MGFNFKKLWLLLIILPGLTFSGCRSKSLNIPTPVLDLEATKMEDVRRTEAAVTLSAAMSKQAMDATMTASAPTATRTLAPSRTPTATFTNTPFLENQSPTLTTLTPQITAPVILSSTDEISDWQCNLIKTTPSYKSVLQRGESFDTHWVILNSGKETWYDNVNVYFRNGNPMHTRDGKFALTTAVKPGDLYEVVVPMKAPLEPGSYTAIWTLIFKKEAFCWFSVDIEVN